MVQNRRQGPAKNLYGFSPHAFRNFRVGGEKPNPGQRRRAGFANKGKMKVYPKARAQIDGAEKQVRSILHWIEPGLIKQHLERARSHLNEAWIAADGQNVRSIEKFLDDLSEAERLSAFARYGKHGDKITVFGRVWTKDPSVIL